MSRIFKFSKFALKLFVSHASKLTDMKIYIYTDNFDIAYVATSGFKINVNEVGLVIPQNAVSNMTDGVINYRIEGYLNGDLYIEQRQSNYYLKTPSFEMQDTNIVAVSTEFIDGGDYKMIIKASEYNADGLSQVEIDATTFAGEMFEVGRADQKAMLEPITITENGTYENENGYSTIEVNVEGGDCPELEDVTITANGEYEGAFGKVIVDVPEVGGDINPDTLREITITENGVYVSKYSSPIAEQITGILPDGSPFYGYGELNGIVYDTQINLNDIGVLESLEFWYKGDGQDVADGWNIILASNSEDSANEGCVEFRYANENILYIRIAGAEIEVSLEEGVWHHFKLNKTGDYICTLFIDDVEIYNNFPLPIATSTNFYINGSVYDREGNRNANGCFGMIKINDHTFVPTNKGFYYDNTMSSLPVVKEGEYTHKTTDIILEGEPYKTINVDVQPNLASLDATLTQNGSYNLSVEDGVDGYNRGTIVVDVPTKVGSITITENGTYYPQDETIKFMMFDGDDVFDLGQGFIQDTEDMTLITIDFKWTGEETGEPMNICGVENSDWDNESCFVIRYYDGNFSAKVGSFEMNFPADYEWHHMEIAYQRGFGFIVFDGSLYKEQLGNFNKPTGNIYVGATNTGGEIFRPFRGYIGDIFILGNRGRITYYPINNGFSCDNGEEITDNIGGGYCALNEETIPNSAPIGYNEIHVNVPQEGGSCPELEDVTITANGEYEGAFGKVLVDVPQEGGGCNLEPLWETPFWQNRDESNCVHYNPSEGMNGFDSAHIDLYAVHEDGKQEAINGLGHLVVTEPGSYTAEKRWETRRYVQLDGDDYFYNPYQSTAELREINVEFRCDDTYTEKYLLGNETYYIKILDGGVSALKGGYYTNPISIPSSTWINVKFDENGLSVTYDGNTFSEPLQEGNERYPLLGGLIIGNNSLSHPETRFYGDISTIEIHDGSNIEVYKPFPNGWGQGSFATLDGNLYENQGDGSATFVEESYEVGPDGWKSVEVNIEGGDCSDIENAKEIIITENGIYKSKYSDIPTGDDFRSYATLINSVYDTGIKPNSNTKVELWWNNTTATQENFECFIFGTQDPTWKIMYTQNMDGVFIAEINYCGINFEFPYQGWHHIIMSYEDGLIINGEKISDFGCNLENEIEQTIYINGNPSSQHNFINGQYGMIKITKDGETTIIVPTAEGFLNTNTGEYLTQVEDGQYEFEEINYDNGDLFKTIIVDVPTDNVPKYPYSHIPTNTIYYKTANGQISENIGKDNIGHSSSFGLGIGGKVLNIVSNTYEDGVGKIVFDDVVYSVGPVMYSNAIETGNSLLELENIVEIQLPSSVTSVRLGAFRQTGLREIILPPNITQIDTYVFDYMQYLYRIVFYSSEPEILGNNKISLDQTTFGKILHSKAYDYSNMENNTYYKDKGWTFETF
jgi:hypothetical protein